MAIIKFEYLVIFKRINVPLMSTSILDVPNIETYETASFTDLTSIPLVILFAMRTINIDKIPARTPKTEISLLAIIFIFTYPYI